MSEEFSFQQFRGQCGALKVLERGVAATAGIVERPGDHVLADAKLAFEQDGAVAVGHLVDDGENAGYDCALANQLGAKGCRVLRGWRRGALLALLGSAERSLNRAPQVRKFEGLREVVVSAKPHGFDSRLHTSMSCDHDDGSVWHLSGTDFDDLQAVHVSDTEVHNDHLRSGAPDHGDTFSSGNASRYIVAQATDELAHELQNGGFVVNDYNFCHSESVSDLIFSTMILIFKRS